jgi:thymidylate kinase
MDRGIVFRTPCSIDMVYLECPLTTCLDRIRTRNPDSAECTVKMSYLEAIEEEFRSVKDASVVLDSSRSVSEICDDLLLSVGCAPDLDQLRI